MKRFSFSKTERISKRANFVKLSRTGKRLQNSHFIAAYNIGRKNQTRIGITVTKKVGGAVTRNRIKRITREYFRLNKHIFTKNWDINIIAKRNAAAITTSQAFSSLRTIFLRIEGLPL